MMRWQFIRHFVRSLLLVAGLWSTHEAAATCSTCSYSNPYCRVVQGNGFVDCRAEPTGGSSCSGNCTLPVRWTDASAERVYTGYIRHKGAAGSQVIGGSAAERDSRDHGFWSLLRVPRQRELAEQLHGDLALAQAILRLGKFSKDELATDVGAFTFSIPSNEAERQDWFNGKPISMREEQFFAGYAEYRLMPSTGNTRDIHLNTWQVQFSNEMPVSGSSQWLRFERGESGWELAEITRSSVIPARAFGNWGRD